MKKKSEEVINEHYRHQKIEAEEKEEEEYLDHMSYGDAQAPYRFCGTLNMI